MKQQGFLKGSAILLGMVFITKAIGLAYKIPLTHMLGGSGMAYYSGAFAVFSPVLAATVSGISASVARLTAESCAFGRYTHLRKVRRTAMMIYTLPALTAAVILVLLSGRLAGAFLPSETAAIALCALAPSLVLCAVLSVQRGYYEGLHNMLPTAVSEIIETVLRAVLGLAGAYAVFRYARADFEATHGCFGQFCRTEADAAALTLPYAAAAAIFAGSVATGIAVASLAVSHRLRGDGITPEQLASDRLTDSTLCIARRLCAHSLPVAGAAVITTLSGFIDLLTVPAGLKAALDAGMSLPEGLDAAAVPSFIYGSYTGLALMVCGLVPTFTAMFGKSSLPSLTEAAARGSTRMLSARVSGLIRVSAVTALPFGALLTVMPYEILGLLFAGRSAEISCAAPALRLLGAGCVFLSVSLPCLSALQTLGRRVMPMVFIAAGSGVKLILNLLLIPMPSLGISGAAAAAAVSQGLICLLSAGTLIRTTSTRLAPGVILKPMFAALLSAAAARLLCDIPEAYGLDTNGRGLSLFGLCTGLGVYLLSLWLMDILPREMIKKYFKKFRKTY
ncbi:MAG: polysaccharide biosynthesis C-terminal domain-containing protein [Ruminococcus sp.]|nr:polysaccharide biosynthesis C-terminal domain-containing protein [Ruminococcus sp.]